MWDGRGDKIKRTEMINKYDKGGLKMLDVKSSSRSLKLIWIKKYLENENSGKWKLFFDYYFKEHGGFIYFHR